MNARGTDDLDSAFVALATRIPYRNRQFQVPSEYSDQIAGFSKRIEPVASTLSTVLAIQKWQRAYV
jgi:hypothetical protein